jgi:hypothetical protein
MKALTPGMKGILIIVGITAVALLAGRRKFREYRRYGWRKFPDREGMHRAV